MNSITITLPIPDTDLSPNARCHWRTKAAAIQDARRLAKWKAWSETGTQLPPRWEKASAKVTFYFPDKRQRDPDNFMARLKATWDGIADAGIVANDSGIWPERPTFAVDKFNPRVEITITQEPAQP